MASKILFVALLVLAVGIQTARVEAFGGRRRQRPAVPEVEEIDLYEVLGIDEEATAAEIKKAYRKLSREYHPDRNQGDEDSADKFRKVSEAYEILNNEEKKFLYDAGGMAMVQQGDQADPMQDMFAGFFGGGGGGNKKGPDAQLRLKVTLEELYNGEEKQTTFARRVVCRGCGEDGKSRHKERCKQCGRCPNERKMVQRQMGNGFIVQQQEEVASTEKCKREEKTIDIPIERGMEHGTQIRFKYASEQKPKQVPGDVIVVLDQQRHKLFERKGNHLHLNMKISLKEALTGFSKTITHLDEHEVEIERDGITKPFETVVYEGEGMPVHEVPSQFGDLHVTFEVLFPKSLSDEQLQALSEVL